MDENIAGQKGSSSNQSPGTARREFLQQAGLAGALLATLGIPGVTAEAQSGPIVGPTAPFTFKVTDHKETKTANGSEVELSHETVGANGIKAVTTTLVKRVDNGPTYTVFTNVSARFYNASDDPSSAQPYHTTTVVTVQYGQKGTVSGQTRTDTIDSISVVDGVTTRQSQTVKVNLVPPFDTSGASVEDLMKKIQAFKQGGFQKAVDSQSQ